MLIEIVVIYGLQGRGYRDGLDSLLVLLIGGIPIAMPTVLSVTMAIGSHRLSQQVCVIIYLNILGSLDWKQPYVTRVTLEEEERENQRK